MLLLRLLFILVMCAQGICAQTIFTTNTDSSDKAKIVESVLALQNIHKQPQNFVF